MTAVVEPAAAGGSSGGDGTVLAANVHGSVVGLAAGATDVLASFTAGALSLRGFNVHGTTDAVAWIEVASVPLPGIRARFSRVLPAYLILPNPEPYSSPAATVRLMVTNEGDSTGDFEGTVFGV